MLITKRVKFEAAHRLEDWSWSPCYRLHGHSWEVEVTWTGEKFHEPSALIDFRVLSDVLRRVVYQPCDHQNLNEVFGVKNCTSEFLAMRFWDDIRMEMKSLLPKYEGIRLNSVKVQETSDSWCTYGPVA